METRNDQPALFSLRDVTVRPVRCVAERRRWDTLVSEHHYLPFSGLFGKALRHVAVVGDLWLALIGWQAGAFKVGVRDRWIGWSREQRFARLHLIANNARFTVLPPRRVPNLASRVLGLSLRRLSRDMEEIHGYPVYVAESRRQIAFFRRLLPCLELAAAGVHPGLLADTGRAAALAFQRSTQGGF